MTDKPTDGTDTSPAKQAIGSERQEAPEQATTGTPLPAPKQVIKQFEQVIAGAIGPARNPLFEKITEGHITTVLENSAKEDERAFEYSTVGRRYKLVYVMIGIAVFFILTVYMMPVDKELYKQLLQGLAVFLGGFGAGYGYRRLQE